jgi:ATP-dependent helicase YprA (DUF1998 family)
MKRKLDSNDVPVPVAIPANGSQEQSFSVLGLDTRLLQAIVKQNFEKPTPVQAKAIPLAIQGRDVLARAKTGTGKTAAYLLPVLHGILKRKEVWIRIPAAFDLLTALGFCHCSYLCAHSCPHARTCRSGLQVY